MGMRDLVTPRHRQSLADALTSCLISEVLVPSRQLWLISGWISDVEVIDNSAGAFSAIAPDWAPGPVRLSAALGWIAQRGGRVLVGMRKHPHNYAFAARLKDLEQRFPGKIAWGLSEKEHRKCLCGDSFALRGSMNFTYLGLTTNEEQMTLTTFSDDVKRLQMELADSWKDVLARIHPERDDDSAKP